MKAKPSEQPLAMPDSKSGGRPRAKSMVQLDLHNAYARLGVSPLMATDEIKEIINRKRKEVNRKRRARGEQLFGEEEAEMTRLQAIEDEIGSPKSRALYDRLNPQNALLTVQPGPQDAAMDPRRRAGLAAAWVVEELGREGSLLSPESLALWAPHGLDRNLLEYLRAFAPLCDAGQETDEGSASALPDIAELSRMGLADSGPNGAAGAQESSHEESSSERLREGSPDG
jgi:hypothetical protein